MKRNPFGFSLTRMMGLIRKEFILIRHDRGTIAMLVILPIMLLIVFGFAIQLDPKHLPTTIISYDHSPLTRHFTSALETSRYYRIVDTSNDERKKQAAFASSKISLAVTIPPNFSRKYIRGENPQLLVEMDGTDPGSYASALANMQPILNQALSSFEKRGLSSAAPDRTKRQVNLVTHKRYNESNNSAFNIIPGLIGVLLTITMVVLTSTAITSERESGTMEMLLSTPMQPTELILGKVLPYIVLGYLQLTSILIFAKILVNLPIEGSLILLYLAATPFMIANLMIGMIFSTLANTPMQAIQMSVFFQLPSMFLSGYVFSFYGMPAWAQWLGHCVPMTYFIRITRGLLLKGNTMEQIIPNIIPLLIITLVLILLTRKVFRTTLD
ncbi:MAG: ABC transporter permease [Legionella sp.]|nr:ABC transporter permease [Legionella sp.]